MTSINKKFKVSVIVITYLHEKYIKDALMGIYSQKTTFPIEVIICNDNSPDNTHAVIEEIIKKTPDNITVKYYNHHENLGMMKNSFFAINKAEGEYLALCEGDDYWINPYKLQKQADFMDENPEISMTFHGAKILKNDKIIGSFSKAKSFKHKKIVNKYDFLRYGAGRFATASVMFKNRDIKMLLKNPPSYMLNSNIGDLLLALYMITRGEIGYLEEDMAVYRSLHKESWTYNKTYELSLILHKKILKTLSDFNHETKYEFSEYVKAIERNSYKNLCIAHIYNDNKFKALLKTISYVPKMGFKTSIEAFKILIYSYLIKQEDLNPKISKT